MRRGDLRRMFGMVLQDTWLFQRHDKDNIRYGRPEATDEQVVEAAKTAFVDHFGAHYAGWLRYGHQRRGQQYLPGEKQLLTIARAHPD
jgi:ATP-binding cassette subfamily B protein